MSEKFRNYSGKFLPGLAKFDGLIDRLISDEGQRPLSAAEKKLFWTEERLSLANKAFELLNERLAPFGIQPCQFQERFIDLFEYSPERASQVGYSEKPPYAHCSPSGRIRLPVYPDLTNDEFVHLVLHEGGHLFGARIVRNKFWWQEVMSDIYLLYSPYRIGASMSSKDREYSSGYFLDRYLLSHNHLDDNNDEIKVKPDLLFGLLDEGVVEKTAREIYRNEFPDLRKESTGYHKEVKYIDKMCGAISDHSPQDFPTSDDAFKLFQQASFGNGNWLPLARTIEKTWGRKSFKGFSEIMIFYDYTQGGYDANKMLEDFLEVQK